VQVARLVVYVRARRAFNRPSQSQNTSHSRQSGRKHTQSGMLYFYVSFKRPWTLALIGLPLTPGQRSSPWSRRTRQELRQQARTLLREKLTRLRESDESSIDGQDRGTAMTTDDSTCRILTFGRGLVVVIDTFDQHADTIRQSIMTCMAPAHHLAMKTLQ